LLHYARALPTPLRVVAPPDWSVQSYEGRELAKYRENTLKPIQTDLSLARQLDQRDNPAIAVRGRNRVVGSRERALFEAHPEMRDQLAAEAGYVRQAGALAREVAAAKAARDDDHAQERRLALKALQYRYVKAVRESDLSGLRQLGR
jgi:hypothetical protein